MQYRPEIDGLRAIAVLPVILYHAHVPGFAGGFVGVDVFFVISGYLIGTILMQDLAQGRYSLARFYERRARRILPVLVTVLAASSGFAWAWLPPEALRDFGQSVAATVLFSSNVLFWLETDYFAAAAETKPLLHTWSLAVEEQFYLIFPLLLAALWRFGARRVGIVLGAVALASLALSEWGWRHAPAANFFLPFSRLWELFAGALAALLLHRRRVPGQGGLALAGLGAIVLGVVLYGPQTPFPSLYALLPVGGTVAVILFAPGSFAARMLAWRPLVAIGLISYSAYLWHQPVFAFARVRSLHPPEWPVMLALAALSLGLAALSWALIEQPFRRRVAPRRAVFAGAALVGAVFIAFGTVLSTFDGVPQRRAPSGLSYAEFDVHHIRRPNPGLDMSCRWGFTDTPACRTDGRPEVLVWGDSYAMHLVPALMASAPQLRLQQQTMSACMPLMGLSQVNATHPLPWAQQCMDFNDRVLAWLKTQDHIRYVVLSSPVNILQRQIVSRAGPVPEAARMQRTLEGFAAVVEALRAAGKQPVFIGPPPRTGADLGACLMTAALLGAGEEVCDFDPAGLSKASRDAALFMQRIAPKLPVIPLTPHLCATGMCDTKRGDVYLYRDAGHLSVEGAAHLGKTLNLMHLVKTRAAAFYGPDEEPSNDSTDGTARPGERRDTLLQCRRLGGADHCVDRSAG